jgi:membrane associated rhomboid family serine protease
MSDPLSNRESTGLTRELKGNVKILGGGAVLLWLIEIIDSVIFSGGLDHLGVIPRSLAGLVGILFAPFLHGGFGHLIANTLPFLLLGLLTMSRKRMDFFVVTAISALTAGLGAWLFGGAGTVHIGASGVIFGYLGFLLSRGWYERKASSIMLSLAVALGFGGMIWGVLPGLYAGVSWQSHLFGFLGGVLTARILGKELRKRG